MSDIKECRTCKNKMGINEFYKHAQMSDGHLNICKKCTRERVSLHRSKNLDSVRAYDRKRGLTDKRKLRQLIYSRTYECKISRVKSNRKYKEKFPEKHKAKSEISKRIKSGKIKPGPCEKCGTLFNTQAHHDDYLKPTEVRWLCSDHHYEFHKEKRNLNNSIKLN